MTPFTRVDMPKEYTNVPSLMASFGITEQEAIAYATRYSQLTVYLNDKYQVMVSEVMDVPNFPSVIHLSIKNLNNEAVHDWRDLQSIKNMLVGEENEGIEIYPAEERLVDMANQYHLWVFADKKVRIPIGWNKRMVSGSERAKAVGANQRDYSA